jgi:predicted RNase H-like HicB family nuclease
MTEHQFTVRFEVDEDGVVIADCLELRGCHAHGRTKDDARENLREVIAMHLEVLAERGESVPNTDTETLNMAV